MAFCFLWDGIAHYFLLFHSKKLTKSAVLSHFSRRNFHLLLKTFKPSSTCCTHFPHTVSSWLVGKIQWTNQKVRNALSANYENLINVDSQEGNWQPMFFWVIKGIKQFYHMAYWSENRWKENSDWFPEFYNFANWILQCRLLRWITHEVIGVNCFFKTFHKRKHYVVK